MSKKTPKKEQPKATKAHAHALYRERFAAFVRKAFAILYPNREFVDNWHISAISYELERVAAGECRRLMINIPPRFLKSLITSVFWPVWLLGHEPGQSILVVSHSLDLSKNLSNLTRQLLAQKEIQAIFPALAKGYAKDTETDITLPQGGGRIAASVDSNITGRGGDIIILDDPLDAADAGNEDAVDRVNAYIDAVLSTRLNNPARSAMVLVMQRLALNDPAAHLASQEDWTKLVLPAICPGDQEVRLSSVKTYLWRQGESLFPDWLTDDVLNTQRTKMGKAAFSAQYLQKPLPPGGGIIEFESFRFFDKVPPCIDARFLSIDAASGEDSGSFSVILRCFIANGRLYISDVYRRRPNFPDLFDLVMRQLSKSEIDHLVVEKASNGYALAQAVEQAYVSEGQQAALHKLLHAIPPRLSKIQRMQQAMVHVDAGRVLLRRQADWLPAFEAELRAFPGGKHDDQVDALSQAINFYARRELHPGYGSGSLPDAA